MNIDDARARFRELRSRTEVIDPTELDEVWAGLETIDISALIGRWKGGEFDTGHKMNGLLEKARCFGKSFTSIDDVQPLVCYDDNGDLFSNIAMGNGEASLWNVEFRGEVTATMVYDGQPVLDHFKKVDENTLMGIMDGKKFRPRDNYFYFLLERV